MDMHQLSHFVTVAQHRSFTKASNYLYMSQPAISHSISALEKELNIKLFTRHKGVVTLTFAGELFLPDALKILNTTEDAKARMQALSLGKTGELKIGYVSVPIVDYFSDCFVSFMEKYPNIMTHYNNYNSNELPKMLASRELDIAFVRQQPIPADSEVLWRYLYTDPFYVALSPKHRFANMKKLTVDMLSGETIVILRENVSPGLNDMLQQLFMNHNFSPKSIRTTNDGSTMFMLARIGVGIAITPYRHHFYRSPDILSIPLDDEMAKHEIGVAWHSNITNPAVNLFLKELEEAFP